MVFHHSCNVLRGQQTMTDRKRDLGMATIYTDLACLIEALPSRQKEQLLGRVPMASYRMTWDGTSDVRENDRVDWNGQEFVMTEIIRDNTRLTGLQYQTGILVRKVVTTS